MPSIVRQAALIPEADHGEQSYEGMGRLAGRKALVTGGDSDIGAAVAIAYAREGADIALAYLPSEEADAVMTTVRELGGLDILVNNAGKQIYQESLEELSDEQFDETLKKMHGSM